MPREEGEWWCKCLRRRGVGVEGGENKKEEEKEEEVANRERVDKDTKK